jgi:hypothetical protein
MPRSPFAAPEPDVGRGFAQIIDPIELPVSVKSAAFDDFANAHERGDPRAGERAFIERLSSIGFLWPWFEHCREEFSQLGAVPRMWLTLKPETPVGLCRLLHHTVSFAVSRERRKDQLLGFARGGDQDWCFGDPPPAGWNLRFSEILPDEPQAVRDLIARSMARFDNGAGQWPPFFPGDRTLVVLARAPRIRG